MTETTQLKAQLYIFSCEACHNKFKVPVYPISDAAYGEFLLRSKCGEMRYLSAIGNTVFFELKELIDCCSVCAHLTPLYRSDLFQRMLGVAFDKDSNNEEFSLFNSPVCPKCGDKNRKKFEEAEPFEVVVITPKNLTSHAWDGMKSEEKKLLIAQRVAELLTSGE